MSYILIFCLGILSGIVSISTGNESGFFAAGFIFGIIVSYYLIYVLNFKLKRLNIFSIIILSTIGYLLAALTVGWAWLLTVFQGSEELFESLASHEWAIYIIAGIIGTICLRLGLYWLKMSRVENIIFILMGGLLSLSYLIDPNSVSGGGIQIVVWQVGMLFTISYLAKKHLPTENSLS